MSYIEVQCDGLIGPTHNYAGLSFGNVASANNAEGIAYPKQAALQGLEKMRFVAETLGIPQLILPPPLRPNLPMMRSFGLSYEDANSLDMTDPLKRAVLRAACSASTMWSANAAMVTPAPDSADGKLHITIANLASALHRSQEAAERYEQFQQIFGAVAEVHAPLPACTPFTDEGAANHMRLSAGHGKAGIEIFVYGRDDQGAMPKRFPARQTKRSCQAIAALHQLPQSRTVIVQQHPDAIDAGVFHNDVIAMSNENVMIYHDLTFYDEQAALAEIQTKAKATGFEVIAIKLSNDALPIADAVSSYLYNSQLLSVGEGRMVIVAPSESQENTAAYHALQGIVADKSNPIDAVHFLDVRESMKNGGGPACLRLRVVMDEAALQQIPDVYRFSATHYQRIREAIESHYPESLSPDQLHHPDFARKLHEIHHRLMQCFR